MWYVRNLVDGERPFGVGLGLSAGTRRPSEQSRRDDLLAVGSIDCHATYAIPLDVANRSALDPPS